MPNAETLSMSVERREVALNYPGAEGVTFQDAVVVVKNEGSSPMGAVAFSLRIAQEGKVIFEGEVRPSLLNEEDELPGGESLRMSIFMIMKKKVLGFASKVNFFGYKAALNWSYEIEASLGEVASISKAVKWVPSPTDSDLVEVEII